MSSSKKHTTYKGIMDSVWLWFAVLALVISGVGMFLLSGSLNTERPPERTEARLIRVDTVENPDYMKSSLGEHSKSKYLAKPIWSFTANDGETYEVGGRYAVGLDAPSVGDTSTVFYYPEHPSSGYIIEVDHNITQSWDIYFALFPILFIIALFSMRRKESQQRGKPQPSDR